MSVSRIGQSPTRRRNRCATAHRQTLAVRFYVLASIVALALASFAGAATVPQPVADAVHGRVMGWAKSGPDWFVVYVDRKGRDWCGLRGASWRIALVETQRLPVRTTDDRRIAGAMCGNALAWVRAGRFSDGKHREAAFMLWTTPSIGATASVYRLDGGRLHHLADFSGDRVVLGRGVVTVTFENRGRSPKGELEDVYRFDGVKFRLTRRR